MKYKFVADASCDVPAQYLEKYDITMIPIEVGFGDDMYPEGLSNREFYDKLNHTDVIPKTAMPNAYKFETFYQDYANKDDIFVMTLLISMEMSPTKVQAQMAADNLGMKNVYIEESGTTTIALGAIIGELCRFIERNPDVKPPEVIAEFKRLRSKISLFAIINDLKYLKHSGRLSSTGAAIGTMLNVKPIVSIVEGKVVNVAKCMGIPKAEAYIMDKIKNMDTSLPIYPIHSDNLVAAERLTEKCHAIIGENQEKIFCEIGYVVGSHVGAKCYGFTFFNKDSQDIS